MSRRSYNLFRQPAKRTLCPILSPDPRHECRPAELRGRRRWRRVLWASHRRHDCGGRARYRALRAQRTLHGASVVQQSGARAWRLPLPRSVLTAVRARRLYARFHQEFAAALGGEFQHMYAIARQQTLVGAREFAEFCRRIGAPLSPAPRELAKHFDPNTIEQAFLAEEGVFDAHRLADIALSAALRVGARCIPDTSANAVEPAAGRRLRLRWESADRSGSTEADWIINASYASLNDLLSRSGLAPIPLVHEVTEIAIVQPPPVLAGAGVTVMDGPFWSCLPFPVLNAHSLSHVRYTPHSRWRSDDVGPERVTERSTHATLMRRDAARFLPAMRDARHVTSLWETKTVLPRSAGDDGRPILVHQHEDAPGLGLRAWRQDRWCLRCRG